jgi:transcriptional regulator with XRE-family HTH domain
MSIGFTKLENTFFTISVNMICMTTENRLGKLISDEISSRNLSIRNFAKLADVSHPTISEILSGEIPSYETCVKLAPILHLPLEAVMMAAGLLPPDREIDAVEQEILHLYRLVPPDKQTQLLEYARFLLSQVESQGKKR